MREEQERKEERRKNKGIKRKRKTRKRKLGMRDTTIMKRRQIMKEKKKRLH